MKNQQGLNNAYRLVGLQLGVSGVLVVIFFMSSGLLAAESAALGGLVNVIPNAFFAMMLFRYSGARSARKIVNHFYLGEALKILASVVLFAVVFAFCHVNPAIFFCVYIGVQLLMWFAPIIFVTARGINRKLK